MCLGRLSAAAVKTSRRPGRVLGSAPKRHFAAAREQLEFGLAGVAETPYKVEGRQSEHLSNGGVEIKVLSAA